MLKVSLPIYTTVTNGNVTEQVAFPNGETPAIVNEFTYSATRMGGAPVITATLNYQRCLDNDFDSKNQYVVFRGEKYYITQVPTAEKSNDSLLWKHELTFSSERIVLENTYFFDVVSPLSEFTQYKDKYRSNTTKFSTHCNAAELVSRLNDSLIASGLCSFYRDEDTGVVTYDGYHVVVDDGMDVTSVYEELSFEDLYVAEVLQKFYDVWELPYYFIGKEIHIGYQQQTIPEIFNYGDELLKITHSNTNAKIVDRITGTGDSTNIPFYYPNPDPQGRVNYEVTVGNRSLVDYINWSRCSKFYNKGIHTFVWGNIIHNVGWTDAQQANNPEYTFDVDEIAAGQSGWSGFKCSHTWKYAVEALMHTEGILISPRIIIDSFVNWVESVEISCEVRYMGDENEAGGKLNTTLRPVPGATNQWTFTLQSQNDDDAYKMDDGISDDHDDDLEEKEILFTNYVNITVELLLKSNTETDVRLELDDLITGSYPIKGFNPSYESVGISYEESGIIFTAKNLVPDGYTIHIHDTNPVTWIPPVNVLMPAIYRNTEGNERFYHATNTPQQDYANASYSPKDVRAHLLYDEENEDGDIVKHVFRHPFVQGKPHELKLSDENTAKIKPSIENVVNARGQLIGEILDVAFDEHDDNSLASSKSDGLEYEHSFFYIKLHVFNGQYGFNLFEYATENDSAKICMTSGDCASCEFEIVADKQQAGAHYDFHNNVQIDASGNIVAGDWKQKLSGKPLKANNDTSMYECWIAVRKDNTTYGIVMPFAQQFNKAAIRPKAGDKFVITGIKMPLSYYTQAETKLSQYLVDYMKGTNDDMFSFGILLSRIWLTQHPSIEYMINENARLQVRYNGLTYGLYVKDFTFKTDSNIVTEITVTLDDELSANNSALQSKLDGVSRKLLGELQSFDWVSTGIEYFLRKDQPDSAYFLIRFLKGIKVGTGRYGISENGTTVVDSITGAEWQVSSDGNARFAGDLTIGEYVSGTLGTGAKIDKSGEMEAESLTLRRWLEAPEFRYNRTDITLGNVWRAAGGGIIEAVTPDYNQDGTIGTTGTLRLKLEDGEIGAVAVDDICQGIFHSEDGSVTNATEDYDDKRGNMEFAGFFTTYFRITSIEANTNNAICHYSLRPVSERWTKQHHPTAGMHFVCYGNFTNTTRQCSEFETLKYHMLLTNQNTWEIQEGNYGLLWGDLTGFSVGDTSLDNYSFYGVNIYFSGHIDQIDNAADRMEISESSNNVLSEGESETVMVVMKNVLNQVTTSDYESFRVTRASADPSADAVWNANHSAVSSVFTIAYSDLELSDNLTSNIFTVEGTNSVTGKTTTGSFSVYGNINGQYTIKAVCDSGTAYDNGFDTDGDTIKELRAYVFRNGKDVTTQIDPNLIEWWKFDESINLFVVIGRGLTYMYDRRVHGYVNVRASYNHSGTVSLEYLEDTGEIVAYDDWASMELDMDAVWNEDDATVSMSSSTLGLSYDENNGLLNVN